MKKFLLTLSGLAMTVFLSACMQQTPQTGAPAADGTAPAGMNNLYMVGIMILLIGGFYFFAIRPQQKKDKETKKMRENLSKGDRVTTIGGIYARVLDVDDQKVTLEVGPGPDRTIVTVARWAIGTIEGEKENPNQIDESSNTKH